VPRGGDRQSSNTSSSCKRVVELLPSKKCPSREKAMYVSPGRIRKKSKRKLEDPAQKVTNPHLPAGKTKRGMWGFHIKGRGGNRPEKAMNMLT